MRGDIGRWIFFSWCLILFLFLGLPFSMHFIWFLLLSLCAAVTIVVKKRLDNSITFFYYFIGSGIMAVAAWRRGCINSSMAVVTSSMAEVEFWLKCVFRNSRGVTPTAIADAVRGVGGRVILHRHLITAAVIVVHSPSHSFHGGDNINCHCCQCKGGSRKGHYLPPLQERGKGGGGEWGGEW